MCSWLYTTLAYSRVLNIDMHKGRAPLASLFEEYSLATFPFGARFFSEFV